MAIWMDSANLSLCNHQITCYLQNISRKGVSDNHQVIDTMSYTSFFDFFPQLNLTFLQNINLAIQGTPMNLELG